MHNGIIISVFMMMFLFLHHIQPHHHIIYVHVQRINSGYQAAHGHVGAIIAFAQALW